MGGFICVEAVNVCGTSSQSCMNIPVMTTKPSQATPIVGPSIICGGTIGTYLQHQQMLLVISGKLQVREYLSSADRERIQLL